MKTLFMDYYRVGLQPVIVLKDAVSDEAVQAWRPHQGLSDLVRDDRYLSEIIDKGGKDIQKISAQDFNQYCAQNKIPVPHLSFFNSSDVVTGAKQRMIHPEILPDFLQASENAAPASPAQTSSVKSFFTWFLRKAAPKAEYN